MGARVIMDKPMICMRCGNEITFPEWYSNLCPASFPEPREPQWTIPQRTFGSGYFERHFIPNNYDIRLAYSIFKEEQSAPSS